MSNEHNWVSFSLMKLTRLGLCQAFINCAMLAVRVCNRECLKCLKEPLWMCQSVIHLENFGIYSYIFLIFKKLMNSTYRNKEFHLIKYIFGQIFLTGAKQYLLIQQIFSSWLLEHILDWIDWLPDVSMKRLVHFILQKNQSLITILFFKNSI